MLVSMALIPFACDRVQPVDLIHGHDWLDDAIFESVLLVAASGLIGAALAAPYCSKHSRATLRPPGPAPVLTPEHIDGLPTNSPLQQLAVEESAAIHDRARFLLSEVDKKGGLAILMVQWVHTVAPLAAQASACQFGQDWAKAWMLVANRPDIHAVAKSCPHAAGAHQQIAGVRMADSTFLSRITAEYPPDLAHALAMIIAPYVTKGSIELPLDTWQDALPKSLKWPHLPTRMEDGVRHPTCSGRLKTGGTSLALVQKAEWHQTLPEDHSCSHIWV